MMFSFVELCSYVEMSSLLYARGRHWQDPLVLGAAFVLPEEEIRRPGYFGLLAGRKVFAAVLRHSFPDVQCSGLTEQLAGGLKIRFLSETLYNLKKKLAQFFEILILV
jgi:hypothetical protein